MLDKPLVYVAGPYTRPDPVENMHRACKEGDAVLEAGGVPYIPHLSGTYHMISPKPYEFWLAYDLVALARCDAVYRFPGESSGADKEVVFSEEHNIPVFFDIGLLRAWIQAR